MQFGGGGGGGFDENLRNLHTNYWGGGGCIDNVQSLHALMSEVMQG